MLSYDIPGRGIINVEHLVLDLNGTMAVDGKIIPAVFPLLELIQKNLTVHIITSDTFGSVEEQCQGLPFVIKKLSSDDHILEKEEYVKTLGVHKVVAIGNGVNDARMLKNSILSIAVIGREGCALEALLNAQIIVQNIEDALALVLNPQRMKATLRSY